MIKSILTLFFCALATLRAGASTSIPAFAELCGVQVGYDTIQTMERQIGRGLPTIGGHPRGGRAWQVRGARCSIYADAFHWTDRPHSDQGKVLDQLSLGVNSDAGELPVAHLPRKQTRFMGVVALGMTKSEVLRLLRGKLPPPIDANGELVWEATGFVRVSRLNHDTNTKWRATLRFEGDRLAEIEIRSL
jgi:hypothetical protein